MIGRGGERKWVMRIIAQTLSELEYRSCEMICLFTKSMMWCGRKDCKGCAP